MTMAIILAPQLTQRISYWTAWKAIALDLKRVSGQYEDDGVKYTIWGYDASEVLLCYIWKGSVPQDVQDAGYSQVQNDADKAEFVALAPYLNRPVLPNYFTDPRLIRRFGNLTATSASEVLLSARAYVEQASEAQRSVVSSSAQDKSGGSGAFKVRITYLTSAYVLKTEDVTLNGTGAVDTVATDIRFIEKFQVVQGAAAAGAIKIMTATGGGGSEFCGIGVGTYDSFLCHHYVPAGRSGFVQGWSLTSDDEVKAKLMGRATYASNVVDEHWDLVNMMGVATPPGFLQFAKNLSAIFYGEKAYIRLTVVPNQATSTTIRGDLLLWEQ